MAYRKFRIALSKGWTLILCSVSVAVLALLGSCRSKKVAKNQAEVADEDEAAEVVDDYISSKAGGDLTPSVSLPGDSKAVKDLIRESNELKEDLSKRMNSVIYGPPEMMQRRAAENQQMRNKIDSLDTEIRKARQK